MRWTTYARLIAELDAAQRAADMVDPLRLAIASRSGPGTAYTTHRREGGEAEKTHFNSRSEFQF